jgi:outer membrane protein TolC
MNVRNQATVTITKRADFLVGGEISIPIPFFNRNQEELATPLANRNVSKTELESRLLAAKQEVDSTYTELALAKERIDVYGKTYLGDLEKMLELTRKVYEMCASIAPFDYFAVC